MSFLRESTDPHKSVAQLVKYAAKKMFNRSLDTDTAIAIGRKLTLSDVLAVDDAIDRGDRDTLARLLGATKRVHEYAMPGRANIQSAATTRQASTVAATAAAGGTAQTTKNIVPGGNIVATSKSIDKTDDAEEEEDIALTELKRLLP
jgi:hypothetical protein